MGKVGSGVEWLLRTVDLNAMDKASSDDHYLIVDVRDKERYDGVHEPIDLVAGHIPNAQNIPFTHNLDADGFFLPAEELKEKGTAEAKQYDDVTVLFTDFKGFTEMSEKVSAKQLVKDLHECFTAFDNIMEKHGIEKIKTIGDSYMAVGGLPTHNTTHAFDVVKAALEIREFIAEGKARKIATNQPYFEIRIGIHTGHVVAGIVGVKKFSYDIWGDTVNTASRLESSGEPGKINISQTTYNIVKDQFACLHRGKITAKGKGEIDMYFLEQKGA